MDKSPNNFGRTAWIVFSLKIVILIAFIKRLIYTDKNESIFSVKTPAIVAETVLILAPWAMQHPIGSVLFVLPLRNDPMQVQPLHSV